MSRIGNWAIRVPDGVTLALSGREVKVEGPKGKLARPLPEGIDLELSEGRARLLRPDERKDTRARHGLARALLANMVTGVSDGFTRVLEIQGVGYRADVSGKTLNLTLGFSHPVHMPIPEGLSVSVEANTVIKVEGIDKELVGQFASDVRRFRPPEPYKGKGVRYQGERVRRKVGKAGAS
jgi:large subunit ribosomal protein L6